MAKRLRNTDHLEVDSNLEKLLFYGEEAKKVVNCNNYFVTNFCRVFSSKYKLVYEAFNGIVDTTVLKIVHKDHDKLNNNVDNLAITWRKKSDYRSHKNYAYKVKMQQILRQEGL